MLVLALGIMGAGFSIEAQAFDNNERKTERRARSAAEVDALIETTDFRFIPTSVDLQTDPIVFIEGYEVAEFTSEGASVALTGMKFTGDYAGSTPYDTAVKKGDKAFVTMSFNSYDDHFQIFDGRAESEYEGKIILDFEITRSSGEATMKVKDEQGKVMIVYTGSIAPN